MADVMMQIGLFQFSVDTAAYQSFNRSMQWKWAEQERIGQRAALQYTGPSNETLSLSGVIYPHYRGGLGQIDSMIEEAGQGKPLILVDGLGYVHGRWVIVSINESRSVFAQGGVPKKQTFKIALKKHSDLP